MSASEQDAKTMNVISCVLLEVKFVKVILFESRKKEGQTSKYI